MKPTRLTPLLAAAALASPLAGVAADIVLSPPAAGGVAVTNAAGNTTRFRVADDGVITLPGLTVLGSSDAFALHLVQGGVRAMRFFTPTGATGPSVVAGHPTNVVAPTASYATIAGGGASGVNGVDPLTGYVCVGLGPCHNEVASPGGTIGGGIDNRITAGVLGTIAGGAGNRVTGDNGAVPEAERIRVTSNPNSNSLCRAVSTTRATT